MGLRPLGRRQVKSGRVPRASSWGRIRQRPPSISNAGAPEGSLVVRTAIFLPRSSASAARKRTSRGLSPVPARTASSVTVHWGNSGSSPANMPSVSRVPVSSRPKSWPMACRAAARVTSAETAWGRRQSGHVSLPSARHGQLSRCWPVRMRRFQSRLESSWSVR